MNRDYYRCFKQVFNDAASRGLVDETANI